VDKGSLAQRAALPWRPIPKVPGAVSLSAKRLEREPENSPCSAQVSGWSCTSTPPICLYDVYRDNLAF
jgi:hypothetical protein